MARQEAKMSLQNGSSGIKFLIDCEKRLCVGERLTISFHTTKVSDFVQPLVQQYSKRLY